MRSRRRIVWVGIAALGLLGGCQDLGFKPKEHASKLLLDSGPAPRLSRKQEADLHVSFGRTSEQQGKLEEARTAYIAAIRKDPKRVDAEHRLAILDDRKGDHQNADLHFARAIKLKPRDPELLCDRGYSLYLRRQWADAEDNLKKALEIDPSHLRSHANLALTLARWGDAPDALVEFRRAGCDDSDARANLALILALEGHLEESKVEYALALAAKPGSARAKEGLKAATVALNGQQTPKTIAADGQPTPAADPALVRTSFSPGP
jgi:tetratricopeptide (TPR) repeat protein